MSMRGRREASKEQVLWQMPIKAHLAQSPGLTPTHPPSQHTRSNCKGAIVFLLRGNNCVYKWTAETSAETRGRVGNDNCGSEFVEGRFSFQLGRAESVEFVFSAVTQRGDSNTGFCFVNICVSSVPNTCWVVYCRQMRGKSGGGGGSGGSGVAG